MKKLCVLFFFGLVVVNAACKRKLSFSDTERELKAAMHTYLLQQRPNLDTSRVHYDVLKVAYYENKDFYDCEFTVRLRSPQIDTTGIMTATVTKDFATVHRKL